MTKQEMMGKFKSFQSSTDYAATWAAFYAATDRMTYRPDLAAMLLLDEILPGDDMLTGDANLGCVWLSIDPDALAEVIVDDEIRELVELGIVYDETNDLLSFGSENFEAYADDIAELTAPQSPTGEDGETVA